MPRLTALLSTFFVITLSNSPTAASEVLRAKCDVAIVGPIERGDEERFALKLKEAFKSGCEEPKVHLYTPGGDLRVAIKIARVVKALYLTTVAPRLRQRESTLEAEQGLPDLRPRNGARVCNLLPGSADRYQAFAAAMDRHTPLFFEALQQRKPLPKAPSYAGDFDPRTKAGDPRCGCASACFFIWVAGVEREGDVVQIHRPYIDPVSYSKLNADQARDTYEQLSREARAFLQEVSVSSALIDRMFGINSQSAAYLSAEEIQSMRMPAYLSELMIAKCGPEPRLEDQSNEPLGAPPELPGTYKRLTPQDRRFLFAKVNLALCWKQAKKGFREKTVADLMK